MKFFTADDFNMPNRALARFAADNANFILEQESFPVYSTESGKEGWVPWTKIPGATQQALVINVEPLHNCPKEYVCSCCGTSYKLIKK